MEKKTSPGTQRRSVEQTSPSVVTLDGSRRESVPRPTKEFFIIPNDVIDGGFLRSIVKTCGGSSAALVWLDLFRRSYGWHRNYARASAQDISKDTGLCLRTVKTALKQLQQRGFIQANAGGHGTRMTYIVGTPTGADYAPPNASELLADQCKDCTSHQGINCADRCKDYSRSGAAFTPDKIQKKKLKNSREKQRMNPADRQSAESNKPHNGQDKDVSMAISSGTARGTRTPIQTWKDWAKIKEELKKTLSPEQYEPIANIDSVGLQNGTILVRWEQLPDSVLKESENEFTPLALALTKAMLPYGVTRIERV